MAHQHLHELGALLDFNWGIGSPSEPNLSEGFEVIHYLVCQPDEPAVLRNEVDHLLSSDVEDDEQGLAGVTHLYLVLAAEVVCKTNMVLLTLAYEGESRVWSLVKGDVVDAVSPVVVRRHNVLANDCISHFLLEVAPSSLIDLLD